jgi:tight adherence protein B
MLPLLLILSLIVAGTIAMAVAFRWTRNARLALKARLALAASAGGAILLRSHSFSEEYAAYGRRIRRAYLWGFGRRWGISWSGWRLATMGLVAGMAGFSIVAALSVPYFIAAMVGIAVFYFGPRTLGAIRQGRVEKEFMALFPDVLDMTIRMLRAGLPVTAAVRAVGNEDFPPVSKIFAEIADKTDIGIPFETALGETSTRIGMADFRFFAVAVSLQRSTGGNLAATLEILSSIIRQRRTVRLKARSATAEVRMSAIVLGGIPIAISGILVLVQPAYLLPLITDVRGNIILGLAVTSMLLGFLTMRQMLRSVTRQQ